MIVLREASPLFNSPLVSPSLKGEGKVLKKKGYAPLLPTLPIPLVREMGQRDGC